MLVLSLDDESQQLLEQALAGFVNRRGRLNCPTPLVALLDELTAIRGQKRPQTATPVPDNPLLSYNEAAEQLGVSSRTVRRLVASDDLATVGRRITAASVQQLNEGPT